MPGYDELAQILAGQRNQLDPAEPTALPPSHYEEVMRQVRQMPKGADMWRADPYTLALGLGVRTPVALPRMPYQPPPAPAPAKPTTEGRWVSPVSGTWNDVPPEFGSKLWSINMASKIQSGANRVAGQAGPAGVGAYLGAKAYDPVASGVNALFDWWNDPEGVVGQQSSRAKAHKARVPYPPDPNKP